jgi:hypothetical protein
VEGRKEMIEIEVNMNSDQVIIKSETGKVLAEFDVERPHKIQSMLEEIFNRIDAVPQGYLGIRLSKVDEDSRTTVDEW